MTVLYLEALVLMALVLSVLMTGAWVVQQRTGNSGWVDTHLDILGRAGRRRQRTVAGRWGWAQCRQWLVAVLVAIWSLRLGLHIAVRTASISDDPRYAAFAREWGVDSRRKMFIFLQNQGHWLGPAGVLDLRRGARYGSPAASAGCSRRADPAGRNRRRSAGGRAV